MKLWKQILILTILDFIVIWLFVKQSDPDPSVAIGIIIVVPVVIIINLIIAGFLYAIKRQYSKAFLINSIISAIIMYNLFIAEISRHQRLRYEGWNFKIKDTTFNITHSKIDSSFSMTYSLNPGGSWGFINGRFLYNSNSYLLITDTTYFIIKNNFLFGYQNNDSIKLTKVDY
jgi:membrane protein YdbS with pleckstrin-like domain